MHTYTVHIPTQSDLLAGDTLKNEQGFEIFFYICLAQDSITS